MGLPSSLKPCLLLIFLCLLNVSTINSKPLREEPVLFGGNFQALYVIGDSLVDSGNNNNLNTSVKSNFAPYGSDFEGGKPTGRFSNGKTIADYIAIYYGLPLAPAYMGLSEEQKNNISTGINYASASCGIFNNTGKRLRLHGLGARKFFINNLKPLGCYPNVIARNVPLGSCDNNLNLAVANYNTKLRKSLTHLKEKFSETSFLYSDYFNFMLGLRGPSTNQVSSNLMNSTSPCCPSVYDGGRVTSCTPGSSSCKVPDTHIFFDPFHPTQLANFMYSIGCFQQRKVCQVV
ncbi:hypothetical protein Bca101_064150 [Brassica carinata]